MSKETNPSSATISDLDQSTIRKTMKEIPTDSTQENNKIEQIENFNYDGEDAAPITENRLTSVDSEDEEAPPSPTWSYLSFDLHSEGGQTQFLPAKCNEAAIEKLIQKSRNKLLIECGQRRYLHPEYESMKAQKYGY